jgi:phosphatidylcholine synthase
VERTSTCKRLRLPGSAPVYRHRRRLALLTIQAIFEGQWKLSFLWIVLAILVDGVDGYLARYFKTKVYAPKLDGGLLDNILDYLNYAFIPALFLIYAKLLPEFLAGSGFLVVLAHLPVAGDAKTEDNYFKGYTTTECAGAVFDDPEPEPWFN